jgi:hypothetical protein
VIKNGAGEARHQEGGEERGEERGRGGKRSQSAEDNDDVFSLFLQKHKIGVKLHIYL